MRIFTIQQSAAIELEIHEVCKKIQFVFLCNMHSHFILEN